jgi:adenylate kinase
MRVLLVGGPGSGKGTQAKRLAAHFGVPHISSGYLLRHHIATGSAEVAEAEGHMSRGDLVPDEVVQEILREPVHRAAGQGGYILDGYPRTVQQAEFAQLEPAGADFAVTAVVHMNVPRDELVRRLLARARGVDDDPAVIEHRLEVFDQHTAPMLHFFDKRGELIEVDAAQPVETVTESILEQLADMSGRQSTTTR